MSVAHKDRTDGVNYSKHIAQIRTLRYHQGEILRTYLSNPGSWVPPSSSSVRLIADRLRSPTCFGDV